VGSALSRPVPFGVETKEYRMISLEDCIALCGLTEAEVLAIAEHEHIPEMAAAALGNYLLQSQEGAERVRDMIRDDIRLAVDRGDMPHARELLGALRHFVATHPEVRPPPRSSDGL
jgi:hypothetical protein